MMLLLTNHFFKRPPWFWGLENIFRKIRSTTYMAGWKIHHEWVDVFPMGKMVIFQLAMLLFILKNRLFRAGYKGDYTAQLYGDHFIIYYKDPGSLLKQPRVSVFWGGYKTPNLESLAFQGWLLYASTTSRHHPSRNFGGENGFSPQQRWGDEIHKNQTETNVFFFRKSPPNQGLA